MRDSNLFGLILATLVAPEINEIDEGLHRIVEEISLKITALAMGFLTQGVSPQTMFAFEVELDGLLKLIGQRTLETVLNRLEPGDPQSLPKHFTYQQQEYSRKEEKTNNRGGIGTRFGTIHLRRFSCEPLQEAREDAQKSFAPWNCSWGSWPETPRPRWRSAWRTWRQGIRSRRSFGNWPKITTWCGRWRCCAR